MGFNKEWYINLRQVKHQVWTRQPSLRIWFLQSSLSTRDRSWSYCLESHKKIKLHNSIARSLSWGHSSVFLGVSLALGFFLTPKCYPTEISFSHSLHSSHPKPIQPESFYFPYSIQHNPEFIHEIFYISPSQGKFKYFSLGPGCYLVSLSLRIVTWLSFTLHIRSTYEWVQTMR